MKTQSLKVSLATNCRIWSIFLGIIFPLIHKIPGIGNCSVINIDENYDCRGGCRYCTNNLKCDHKKKGRYGIKPKKEKLFLKVIRVMRRKFNITGLFINEKIEMGLDIYAIDHFLRLFDRFPKDINFYFTTKLIDVLWEHMGHLPRVHFLVTLTNPFNILGLEGPKIPSFQERVNSLRRLHKETGRQFGIRVIIMQRSEIGIMVKTVESLIDEGVVDPKLCMIGFLRSAFFKGKGAIQNAVYGYIDGSEFEWHWRQGESLLTSTMDKAIAKLKDLPVVFDRVPVKIRKKYPELDFGEYIERRQCYVVPGKPCIAEACSSDYLTCNGLNKKTGEVCSSLKKRTKRDVGKARTAALKVTKRKDFAYGERQGDRPNKEWWSVLRILFNSSVTKHFGYQPITEITCNDETVVNLKWKEVIYNA